MMGVITVFKAEIRGINSSRLLDWMNHTVALNPALSASEAATVFSYWFSGVVFIDRPLQTH